MAPASSNGSTPFHTSPQHFHKTKQKAAQTVQNLVALIQKGPRTMIGTIADTAFHASMGYVTCQTQTGVVQVYGVPPGSVISGMRIYCRQMGGMATTKHFVYDGPAHALSSMGSSGSLIVTSAPTTTLNAPIASLSGIPSPTGLTASPTGCYWSCAFYIPVLPPTSVTILQMAPDHDTSTTLTLELLPSGLLQFRSSDGHGYVTLDPIVPQQMHWVMIQPGSTTGTDMAIDELSAYTGLQGTSDVPTFTGNGTTYTMSLLSSLNGTHLCPPGSWISKIGYGGTGGQFLSSDFPDDDTDLYNGANTYLLLLCRDDPSIGTMANSAAGLNIGAMPFTSPASIQIAGPY